MTKDEALMLAMEAMEITGGFDVEINAIKEALAQPEQESVAITITGKLGNIYSFTGDYSLKKGDKVYTTPPQRTWVGLTSVDWNDFNAVKSNDPQYVAAWAEAKLKEKNT